MSDAALWNFFSHSNKLKYTYTTSVFVPPWHITHVGTTRFVCNAFDTPNNSCSERARGFTTHPSGDVCPLYLLPPCLSERQTLSFGCVIPLPVVSHNVIPVVYWGTGHTEDIWLITGKKKFAFSSFIWSCHVWVCAWLRWAFVSSSWELVCGRVLALGQTVVGKCFQEVCLRVVC